MNNNIKLALLLLMAMGVGATGYYLYKHESVSKTEKLKNQILGYMQPDEQTRMLPILNKMSEAELADILAFEKANHKVTDPLLRQRLLLIGKKYNIFT